MLLCCYPLYFPLTDSLFGPLVNGNHQVVPDPAPAWSRRYSWYDIFSVSRFAASLAPIVMSKNSPFGVGFTDFVTVFPAGAYSDYGEGFRPLRNSISTSGLVALGNLLRTRVSSNIDDQTKHEIYAYPFMCSVMAGAPTVGPAACLPSLVIHPIWILSTTICW